jgi:hypothetical protein
VGALPTFIVIGAEKCGTTSLHHYLGEHPEVQVSRPKELHWFCGKPDPDAVPELTDPRDRAALSRGTSNSHLSLDWYCSHFDPSYAVRGESTPKYSSPGYPGTADRIAATVPDALLIYCVRDPVERALSSYRFARTRNRDERPIEAALTPGGNYAMRSRFARCLEPYLGLFPRERIHVVEAERLDDRRAETMREAFAFLGLDPGFSSPTFERRWNVTARQGLRFRALTKLRERRAWTAVAKQVPQRALWLAERATSRREPAGEPERLIPPGRFVDSLREDATRFRELTGLELDYWQV